MNRALRRIWFGIQPNLHLAFNDGLLPRCPLALQQTCHGGIFLWCWKAIKRRCRIERGDLCGPERLDVWWALLVGCDSCGGTDGPKRALQEVAPKDVMVAI